MKVTRSIPGDDPPRLHAANSRRGHGCLVGRRAAPARTETGRPVATADNDDPALDGRRHGANGDVGSEDLHSSTSPAGKQTCVEHVPVYPDGVDNIRLSQGLEEIAKVMDRGTLIRSHRVGDLGFILHSRHQYHWHTGYEPPQSVAVPHMGAWIAKLLGPRTPEMPPFVVVGQNMEIGAESDPLSRSIPRDFLVRIPVRS